MTERWTCPQCGQLLAAEQPSCPVCRITRENRAVIGRASVIKPLEKPPQDVEVRWPVVIRDARFNLPVATGGTLWTSGVIVAVEAGLFLLSDKDALDPQALAQSPPPAAGPVGASSVFLPVASVKRAVHNRLVGYFLDTPGGKLPLRLSTQGWEEFDAVCDGLKIAHT
ncbi:MAG TPA: hypothetical protein VEJ18_03650 [Planctomycetota bacterium]|nr:hypothetical protein [Planctomycetota bacterium]